jgi:hypothetical protein
MWVAGFRVMVYPEPALTEGGQTSTEIIDLLVSALSIMLFPPALALDHRLVALARSIYWPAATTDRAPYKPSHQELVSSPILSEV